MKYRSWLLLGVTFAILGATAATYAVRENVIRTDPPGPPTIRCASMIDLGRQEVGSVAIGELTITNDGGQDLVIDQIRATCSCTGLERNTPDGYRRIETLTVPPGTSVDLAVRLSVPGPVGEPFASTIAFRTNDPERPDVPLAISVPLQTGGIRPDPKTVVFGAVPLGTTAEQEVAVIDYSSAPRTVRSLYATPEDQLSAEVIVRDVPTRNAESAGKTIALLRVRLKADRSGHFQGNVRVYLEGRQNPDEIPVVARIDGPVTLTPSSIVLPLVTGDGKPQYESTCMCSLRDGHPATIKVVESPDGLTAAVEDLPDNPGMKRIKVRLDPKAIPAGLTESRTIRLEVTTSSGPTVIELPVLCRGV